MTDVPQPSASAATTHWQVRAFGQVLGDIEVDPLAMPRALAAARVLAACLDADGRRPEQDELMAWPVSRRLQGLLAVTIATRGEHWVLTAQCSRPDCGAPMDLPLSLDDFRREVDPTEITCTLPGGCSVDVAVPTGKDQLAWLAAGDAGAGALVDRLVTLPPDVADIAPDWLESIEAVLEQADPLTTLEIETACPECGAETSVPLDLEARCLALLAAQHPRLLDDIHALATAYHWSEREIMAIPPDRRRQYLARIDRMWS
jgi:hypothetical protein